LVLGFCSNTIFIKTVIGIDNIKPGIPQRNPQNSNIIKMVITLIENDLPINIGSKIPPKIISTREITNIKNKRFPVVLISINAKIDNIKTEITEPIIWIKLREKFGILPFLTDISEPELALEKLNIND